MADVRNRANGNAHTELLALMQKNKQDGVKPSLLLHCCCAPCATACLEVLNGSFDITLYFYNPNISSDEEYNKRLAELKNYVLRAFNGAFNIIDGGYDHAAYLKKVSGLESAREGGARCSVCFEDRLSATKAEADKGGYSYFATTLTVSPLKNAKLINSIGEAISTERAAQYLPTDFKKQGGFLRSVKLSEEYGLYRQNYCGCEFSAAQAEEKRNEASILQR